MAVETGFELPLARIFGKLAFFVDLGYYLLMEKTTKYVWNEFYDTTNEVISRMLFDHPKQVLKDYSVEELKKIFLENIEKFDKRNKNFWQFVLGSSDEEAKQFNARAGKGFRDACKIWHY